MKADTVLIDVNEVKVSFWDRLVELSRDKDSTVKDLLVELRSQILIINELTKAKGEIEDGK